MRSPQSLLTHRSSSCPRRMMRGTGHILPRRSTFLSGLMALEGPDPCRRRARHFSAATSSSTSAAASARTAMTMLRAAIAWHVFALTNSAFHLGLIGLVQFLPALGLTLVGGAVADTYERRRVIMLAQLRPARLRAAAVRRHAQRVRQRAAALRDGVRDRLRRRRSRTRPAPRCCRRWCRARCFRAP